MSRSALRLAALASSAVPGVDPVSVEGHPVRAGDLYELAFVIDSQDRHWVVKAARTAAAGALLEDVSALMTLLARRLDVTVPMVRGVATMPSGRAVVHARVPGHPLDFAGLPPGAPLTADVGRTLAHIHNLEIAVFEEAGRASYDAESHRRRMLSELDRASATGHVPSGLLSRWEARLEDVSLWRFVPTPVHGAYIGSHVLATFDDPDDAGAGRVRGVIGWEDSRVGDPADDLAPIVAQAEAGALDTVLEAYVQSRIDRADPNLLTRAGLAAEMAPVQILLRAISAGEAGLVAQVAGELRALDEQIRRAEDRAEAQRRRTERLAREERDRVQAEQAAATSPPATEVDEATQPFTPDPAPSPNGPFEGERVGTPTSSPTNTQFGGAPSVQDDADETGASADGADGLDAVDGVDAVEESHEGASDFVPVEPRRIEPPEDGGSAATQG